MAQRGGPDTTVRDGVEIHRWTARDEGRPSLVLLHEGLGSAGLWRGFPAALAAATGCETIAYSRAGHGRSAPLAAPHGPDYLHEQAAGLPALLRDVLEVDTAVLVGHSDGASIALLHAAATAVTQVPAIALMAPHVVVEEETVAGVEQARRAYLDTELPDRLGRHHDDADALFWAWNDLWRSPSFRDWDITGVLPQIAQRVLLVQCADDEYGTLEQLTTIEDRVTGPVTRLVPQRGGHAPHLAHPAAVVAAIRDLVADVAGHPGEVG